MMDCNKRFNDEKFENITFLESENFRVIPSLGSLVEGWLLLIPKDHFISFSQMSEKLLLEAEIMVRRTSDLLKELYNTSVVVFENGANSTGSKIGCGVDYAHIHLVSLNVNVKKIIDTEYKNDLNWVEITSIKELNRLKSNSYFFINSSNGLLISKVINPRSQVVRKGIAQEIGKPDKFDWKEHSFNENIVNTIERFNSINLIVND